MQPPHNRQRQQDRHEICDEVWHARPAVDGDEIFAIPARIRFLPFIGEVRAVDGGEDDKCDVAEDDDADRGVGHVAVGFRGEDLEVEAQEGEFREGGRGEVDVAFDDGVFEPPGYLGFVCCYDVPAGVPEFDEDYGDRSVGSVWGEG